MIRSLRPGSLLLVVTMVMAATSLGAVAGRAAPEGTAAAPPKEKTSPERPLRVEPRARQTTKGETGSRAPKAAPKERSRARRPAAAEAEAILSRAQEAAAAGRGAEARGLLESLDRTRLPAAKSDDAAYLGATLTEEGAKQGDAFTAYLKEFARGRHRREATLALARLYYVEGDYAEADRLLTIFSPGIEKDRVGRQGLVLRGLSQLARGDAVGALQFFAAGEKDVKGSAEEEAYYFATAQAGLRAGKPQQAVDALRVLLERHAQGAYAPQALYAMGMALEQSGRASDATNVFRQVAQRFPESYEATRVRDRGIRPGGVVASGLPIGGGYALQIGAFSRRDLADALARDLRLANVPDVSVKQGNESPAIYRVRAGAFASRDEARALGERLRRERGFSFTVVPH
ncbi:MAG TPA: SPOR domain-containing protein [Candidatus Eisenbacteria bacterium]|nr:SPOR domain-containing protein [Candidatus Eisenbacteria bacterium]